MYFYFILLLASVSAPFYFKISYSKFVIHRIFVLPGQLTVFLWASPFFPALISHIHFFYSAKICKEPGNGTVCAKVWCISPILNDALTIWEPKECKIAVLYFCTGFHTFALVLAVQGDVGWIPGSTGQKCERIRLWSQPLKTSENRVSKKVFLCVKITKFSLWGRVTCCRFRRLNCKMCPGITMQLFISCLLDLTFRESRMSLSNEMFRFRFVMQKCSGTPMMTVSFQCLILFLNDVFRITCLSDFSPLYMCSWFDV